VAPTNRLNCETQRAALPTTDEANHRNADRRIDVWTQGKNRALAVRIMARAIRDAMVLARSFMISKSEIAEAINPTWLSFDSIKHVTWAITQVGS
jgi:hypothetical protein